jgi:hypothetical protein
MRLIEPHAVAAVEISTRNIVFAPQMRMRAADHVVEHQVVIGPRPTRICRPTMISSRSGQAVILNNAQDLIHYTHLAASPTSAVYSFRLRYRSR